jgi:hypothetical protein
VRLKREASKFLIVMSSVSSCFRNATFTLVMFNEQSSMVFYENCGLENLYGIARYCQVHFAILTVPIF